MSSEYFHPDIETMPSEKMKESIILPKLRKQLRHVMSCSHFYQKKLHDASPEWLYENFQNIPFTEKGEILADQNDRPPFGNILCVDREMIQRVHRTSGTTTRPIFIALTRKDIETTVRTGARCFWSAGLRPGDTVVHCLNYCLWMGGYTDHQALESTGATVVPYGVGNTFNLIQTIMDIGIDTIHCTPSYLTRIEELLKDKFQMMPRDLGLKKGLFAGESGIDNPNLRKQIEKKWGMRVMNANYGLSDVLSMFGAECREARDLHFMGSDVLLPEIIDPDRGTLIPIVEGAQGELVLTNLEKEAMPLIRFRTHDIIEVAGTSCRCNRTGFRFRIIGRSDDMIVVKGINVFPQAIGEIIHEYPTICTGEFLITAPKQVPIQNIDLAIEVRRETEEKEIKDLKAQIEEKMYQRLNISPGIRIVPEGTLPRTEGKAKRLVRS
jgi:phenylacetate-CoA ligase